MDAPPARRPSFLREQHGFTGAEKALLVCFGLAIIGVVGALLGGGSKQAGDDARRTLSAGLAASGPMGTLMSPSALPQAGETKGAPGQITAARPPQAPAAVVQRPPAQALPRTLPLGQPDTAYDGAFVGANGQVYPRDTPINQIPPVRPSNGARPIGTAIYVNGINTDVATQSTSLQAIADKTGFQVIGIHNSTNGMIRDLAQCLGDKADLGSNAAVDQLADQLYAAIQRGEPIHVMAHSQGGLITSRALQHVQRRLRIEDGMSRAEAERAMSLINVETFGAAAQTYPNGPNYVHYVNRFDLVPTQFGLGATRLGNLGAGRGARVIRFNDFHFNPIASHGFDDVYLDHRQPFGQARRR
jgi:hypothetical protein